MEVEQTGYKLLVVSINCDNDDKGTLSSKCIRLALEEGGNLCMSYEQINDIMNNALESDIKDKYAMRVYTSSGDVNDLDTFLIDNRQTFLNYIAGKGWKLVSVVPDSMSFSHDYYAKDDTYDSTAGSVSLNNLSYYFIKAI